MLHLKELRTQKGLTQSELSKALNVSASSIGMYEQGRREPDTTTLAEIAAYFNVTTDYLLGRTDQPHDPHTPPATGPQKEDEGGTILMRAQNELDPDELQQLENMAEYFLDKKLKGK